jgi:hypothetical protein
MIMDFKKLFEKLSNYYWSPEHPSSYVLQLENGAERGIGLLAHQNYGAFNLSWGSNQGRCETDDDQTKLITGFSKYRVYAEMPMGKQKVGDWTCMLKPEAFLAQLAKTPVAKPVVQQELIQIAMRASTPL